MAAKEQDVKKKPAPAAPAATPAPAPAAAVPAAPPLPGVFAANPVVPGLLTPKADLRESVIETLQGIYDPEIPVNIYDLGLVYGLDVSPEGKVGIKVTLTSPACPVAESLPPEVQAKVKAVPGVMDVKVDLVWEPPWGKHLLSEAARLQLGLE